MAKQKALVVQPIEYYKSRPLKSLEELNIDRNSFTRISKLSKMTRCGRLTTTPDTNKYSLFNRHINYFIRVIKMYRRESFFRITDRSTPTYANSIAAISNVCHRNHQESSEILHSILCWYYDRSNYFTAKAEQHKKERTLAGFRTKLLESLGHVSGNKIALAERNLIRYTEMRNDADAKMAVLDTKGNDLKNQIKVLTDEYNTVMEQRDVLRQERHKGENGILKFSNTTELKDKQINEQGTLILLFKSELSSEERALLETELVKYPQIESQYYALTNPLLAAIKQLRSQLDSHVDLSSPYCLGIKAAIEVLENQQSDGVLL